MSSLELSELETEGGWVGHWDTRAPWVGGWVCGKCEIREGGWVGCSGEWDFNCPHPAKEHNPGGTRAAAAGPRPPYPLGRQQRHNGIQAVDPNGGGGLPGRA